MNKRQAKKIRQKKRKHELAKQQEQILKGLEKTRSENDIIPKEKKKEEPLMQEIEILMSAVFNRFKGKKSEEMSNETPKTKINNFSDKEQSEIYPNEDEENVEKVLLSNRKKKEKRRLKIAELKQLVSRPEIVEEHDANSADPRLLIELKCTRNTIVVPVHWGRKRKYLQGKRGFEKPPFDLPTFIKNTGITAIRDEQLRIYSEKTRKQKQRNRVRGKSGKMAIDYQTLHDAFFVHQSKPPLTRFGDIYFEMKEREMQYRSFVPGRLTDRLKKGLGMSAIWRVIAPNGIPVYDDLQDEKPREGQILAQGTEMTWDETANDGDWIRIVRPVNGWIQAHDEERKIFARQVVHNSPTPWLIAQQRFGPPPAYPDMKIPGLNAPVPPGHEYGYGEGQWGKPPIGPDGQPLYGNPFGLYYEPDYNSLQPKPHWGDLEEVSDSDEETSEEEEEESDDGTKSITPGYNAPESGFSSQLSTTSGMQSGIDSASSLSQSEFNLRKRGGDTPESKEQLYTVVRQHKSSVKASNFFGSSNVYDLKKMEKDNEEPISGQKVEVALDPSDFGSLDEQSLKRKFDEALKDQDENEKTRKRRRPGSRFDRVRKEKEYDVKF